MANAKEAGPMCQLYQRPIVVEDGTLCRCESPLPGTIGKHPEMEDNFAWPVGVDASKPLGEEAWFERQYPNLLEDARLKYLDFIDLWVQSNWGKSPLKEKTPRISVIARDTAYRNEDGSIRKVEKNDNRFERCGDVPQTPYEADKVLGSWAIDIETPVEVNYSNRTVGGKLIERFDWVAVMYVEDVLGLQADNQIVHQLGRGLLKLAPSRRVKRARWNIRGGGLSYVIVAGDTLSKIALALGGVARDWKEIFEANRTRIKDPNQIIPGQRIFIPTSLTPP